MNPTQVLADDLLRLSKDPYKFVLYAFEWGEGELSNYEGPDDWQKETLCAIRDGLLSINDAIQIAVASGHGIGKSALVSWIILWAMATKPNTRGVVTANTDTQLRTKTWPEVSKWYRLSLIKNYFTMTATAIYSNYPEYEKTWRIDATPWSENNTEAFAGLHNQGNRIILIFDEASAIADIVWEVAEGALTDENTEIVWCVFGNPTRNVGRFRECFRRYKHRWFNKQVDSRTAKYTNKKQIDKWVEDYGVDSDFVKVRVRGIFPSASDRQFISSELIDAARGKKLSKHVHEFAPIIIGVDPAIYGDDECCIYLRQGLMSKRLATYRKIGDDSLLAGYVARFEDEYKADKVFVDMGYGTGVVSAGRQMGRDWVLVSFGSKSTKEGYLNKRAEMWGDMLNWLKEGGSVEDDPVICDEFGSPEYEVKLNGLIKLESKDDMRARGVPSPNRADALALTFTFPVMKKKTAYAEKNKANNNYNPLG
jgi:hypothetical protein